MPTRVYTLTFASAATGTNKVYVGPHSKAALILSSMTDYNSGTGNATVTLRYGLSATDTHVAPASNTITTYTAASKGIYPMPYAPTTYLSVGFTSIPTGSAANTVDVSVYEEF